MSWKYYLVMVIPPPARHPPDMSNSTLSKNDRLAPRRLRTPAAVAGVAVLAFSLLLSVAPAMGAANSSHGGGNGTSGNLKVHDAGTGVETSGTDNEPHVCAFWLGFTFDAPYEAGTWVLVSWAPTGDGSTIASGVYDTSGDGIDSSSVLDVPAGHYRVEWAATGASASKKKTFWVDAGCGQAESQAEESQAEESQAEEPTSPAEEPTSPAEESQAEEPTSPAEESQAEEPQAEEPTSAAEGTQADESTSEEQASDPADQSVADESTSEEQASDPADQSVADESTTEEQASDPADESDSQEPPSPGDESVDEDPATPPQDSEETPGDAAGDEDAAEANNPGTTGHGNQPAQDVLGSAASDDPVMSDTAIPTKSAPDGLVATMVLLALIVAHGAARRSRSLDRDLVNGGI